MKRMAMRLISAILVVAMMMLLMPEDLRLAIGSAEESKEAVDWSSRAYDVNLGSFHAHHLAGDRWEIDGDVPEGLAFRDGTLTLDGFDDANAGLWAAGPLAVVLSGENRLSSLLCEADLSIQGPGSLLLTSEDGAVSVWTYGSFSMEDCRLTISGSNPETFCHMHIGGNLYIGGAELLVNEASLPHGGIFVERGSVLIDHSQVTIHSGEEFGLMAVNEGGEGLEPEAIAVLNSTLNIDGSSVSIYPHGNMRVENSALNLETDCDLFSFTGFNSYDCEDVYDFVLKDSTLRAVHELPGETPIALGFYNANVIVENSRVETQGTVDARYMAAKDSVFDLRIPEDNTGGRLFSVRNRGEFEGCTLTLDAPGSMTGMYGDQGDVRFENCDIEIRAAADGLTVNQGALAVSRSRVAIEAGETGIRNNYLGSTTLIGSDVAVKAKGGFSGNQSTLAVLGGDVRIDAQEIAVAVQSFDDDPEAVIQLGASTVVDDGAARAMEQLGTSFMHTFGAEPRSDRAEWDESRPGDQFALRGEGVAKQLRLHGDGSFDGQISVSQSRLSAGMTASFMASYTSGADETTLMLELPAALELVDGSLTANGAPVEAALEDGKLTLERLEPSGTVRFTAMALEEGAFEVKGSAALRTGNEQKEGLMQSCAFEIANFSLGLPTATGRRSLAVSGSAAPGSAVTFYDGGKDAGSAQVNLAGRFSGVLTLHGDQAEHPISVRVETPQGRVLRQDVQTLRYDAQTAEVDTVTMTNLIHGIKDTEIVEEVTVIDFSEPAARVPQYAFWPSYPEISFEVRFTNCHDPLGMGAVYLTTTDHSGRETRVDLSYDLERDVWVGSAEYDEYTMPRQVSVAYTGGNFGTIALDDGSAARVEMLYRPMADDSVQLGQGNEALFVRGDEGAVTISDGQGHDIVLRDAGEGAIGAYIDGEHFADITVAEGQVTYTLDGGGAVTVSSDGESLALETPDGTLRMFADGSYSVADGAGTETRYQMEGDNETAITYADGTSERFRYDAATGTVIYTGRDGAETVSTYDANGQLSRVEQGGRITYAMEETGNTQRVTDEEGGVTELVYDARDRLVEMRYPDGLTVAFAYDDAGRLLEMRDPFGNVTAYAYDVQGDLASVRNNGALIVEYSRDGDGALRARRTGDGTLTRYAYDENGLLTDLRTEGKTEISCSYGYDDGGRLVSMADSAGEWRYAFDEVGQMTEVVAPDGERTSYAYTSSGTRARVDAGGITTEYASNALNQITRAGETAYTYDANGCLTGSQSPEGETVYEWTDGTLTRVLLPDGTEYHYGYDAFGNRDRVTVNGETTRYLWVPAELPYVIGEIRPDGSTVQYVQGDGLAAQVENGSARFYHFDMRGSTLAITDEGGQPLNTYRYNADGTLAERAEQVPNPFGYVGQYGIMTDGSGLWYMRARDVLQETGSFISPDPAGQGNDLNLYRYALNNPVNFVDVTGEGPLAIPSLIKLIMTKVTTVYRVNGKVSKVERSTTIKNIKINTGPETDMFQKTIPENAAALEAAGQDAAAAAKSAEEAQAAMREVHKQGPGLLEWLEKNTSRIVKKIFGRSNVGDPPRNPFENPFQKYVALIVTGTAMNAVANASETGESPADNDLIAAAILTLRDAGEFTVDKVKQLIEIHERGRKRFIDRSGMPEWFYDIVDIIDIFDPFMITDLVYIYYGIQDDEEEIAFVSVEEKEEIRYIDIYEPDPKYESDPRDADGISDPSGYVYETVPETRVAGVTATLYCKPSLDTPDEEAVAWNAEDYDQINPQLTDWNGQYGWMVNPGWYKVVYEKEGYAPAESEWLPVPPVQTEVNIPMIPLGAPEIAEAAAYDSDRVELRFDHFAQTGSTGECLSLQRADGAEIGFDLVCLDETFDAQGVSVGSRFRLWCREDLAAGDRLILNAAGVTGANGVTLESGETALEVTAVVGRIDAQTPEIVAASDSAPITFTVFSPDGAPMSGVALSLTSPSACLALAYDMVVTDEAGTATVSVSGVKPGNGVVLAMEAGGTRATAAMRVVGAGDFPQEYVRACAASRAWLEDLRNTWTDGRNEDETIAGAYVDTFTAASDALRGLLPGDAAQDLAQLDAWDADMRGMIFGRINGRFSSEEFSRIASILDARNRMYLYSAGLK